MCVYVYACVCVCSSETERVRDRVRVRESESCLWPCHRYMFSINYVLILQVYIFSSLTVSMSEVYVYPIHGRRVVDIIWSP